MSEGYAGAFQTYYDKGWRGILPLPFKAKTPPPSGYSGYGGATPSYPDIMAWSEDFPDGNLALRLPENVIGLDVDAYGDKTGAQAWHEGERRWGPLPPTVRSTSRDDRISGIRLYKIPADVNVVTEMKFPEIAAGNVDVCKTSHRYVVAWPSIHPEGRKYQWLNEAGEPVDIPNLDDIPDLPERWLEGLRTDAAAEITMRVDADEQIASFPEGRMSPAVSKVLDKALHTLSGVESGSRHDACIKAVLHLIRLGVEGEPGVRKALDYLGSAFVKATKDRSTEADAIREFGRMVHNQRGHDLIASTPKVDLYELAGIERRQQQDGYTVDTDSVLVDEVTQYVASQTGIPPEMEQSAANSFLFSDRETAEYETPAPRINRDELPFIQQLYGLSDLAYIEPAEPLIKDLLYQNTLVQIAGDPGSYKTFFTLSLAMAVASNMTSWESYPIKHNGTVIYVAAEGLSGMRARSLAWCEAQGVNPDTVRIKFFPRAFQLGSREDVDEVLDMVIKTEAVLVVLDTRARVTLGLDENKSDEQAQAIEAAEMIRTRTGATILAVHHSSRSGSAGRGSNAWDGAVWSELRSGSDGDMSLKVHCEKHKDAPSGCDHQFVMKKWTVSTNLMPGVEEENRTTLVVHQKTPLDNDKPTIRELQGIVKVVADHAPKEGLSMAQVVELSGQPRTSVYRQLKAGMDQKMLVDTNPGGTVTRYGPHPDLRPMSQEG